MRRKDSTLDGPTEVILPAKYSLTVWRGGVERRKCAEIIDKAKFVSVLSDGSTDVSLFENEIVYIHFCLEGVMYSYFTRLVAVERGNAKP